MRGDRSSGRGVSPASPAIQHETVIVDAGEEGQDAGQGAGRGDRRGGPRVIRGRIVRMRTRHRVAFKEAPAEAAKLGDDASPVECPTPVSRPALVALLISLAHRIEDAIATGEYADRADAARRLGYSRARMTQLVDLTLLAPDLQEIALHLTTDDDREPLAELAVRRVAKMDSWNDQRAAWAYLAVAAGT